MARRLLFQAVVNGLQHALRLALEGFLESGSDPEPPQGSGRPLVLLHGFACSSKVLLPLQRRLQHGLARPTVRLSLGVGLGDIRRTAERAYAAIERMAAASRFQHVDVVAHSLGGVVAAYLLKCLDEGRRVRRVVTLGSPHQGVPSALLGVFVLGAISRSVWQMLPGSGFVRQLVDLPVPQGSELFSIAGERDPLVPVPYTRLPAYPGHRNLVLPGANHWDLLFARLACAEVSRVLMPARWCESERRSREILLRRRPSHQVRYRTPDHGVRRGAYDHRSSGRPSSSAGERRLSAAFFNDLQRHGNGRGEGEHALRLEILNERSS